MLFSLIFTFLFYLKQENIFYLLNHNLIYLVSLSLHDVYYNLSMLDAFSDLFFVIIIHNIDEIIMGNIMKVIVFIGFSMWIVCLMMCINISRYYRFVSML